VINETLNQVNLLESFDSCNNAMMDYYSAFSKQKTVCIYGEWGATDLLPNVENNNKREFVPARQEQRPFT
jgi:hypothetical protein